MARKVYHSVPTETGWKVEIKGRTLFLLIAPKRSPKKQLFDWAIKPRIKADSAKRYCTKKMEEFGRRGPTEVTLVGPKGRGGA